MSFRPGNGEHDPYRLCSDEEDDSFTTVPEVPEYRVKVNSGARYAAWPGYLGKSAEWFQGKCKKALVPRFHFSVRGET